ncbi:MAG: TnsA-like heteromeric transposase endonuclease subunit [Acidimicrobiia bacterium]
MSVPLDTRLINLCYRDHEGTARHCSLDQAGQFAFEECRPVRQFPAHRKQRHMPGFYWFATTRKHIPYESRLEMTVLMGLDFDHEVLAVSAQPFRLECGEGRKARQHVPDFFVLLRSELRRVVDVKPADQAADPANQEVFGLTRSTCDSLGWEYVIATEPEPTTLANLSWLAGYRRQPADPFGLAPLLVEGCQDPISLREIVAAAGPPAIVRPLLFHLLWSQVIRFDLACPLNDGSVLLRQPGWPRAA